MAWKPKPKPKYALREKPLSYGKRVKVPNKLELFRRLTKLPPKFQPAVIQALITHDVSMEVAREMQKRGIELNTKMVSATHLARPMSRHLGVGTSEGIGSDRAKKAGMAMNEIRERRLKKMLESKNPEIAESARKQMKADAERRKPLVHTVVTRQLLERKLGAPELGKMVRKYYSDYEKLKPERLENMRIEDLPFEIGGYMTWGEKGADGNFNYKVRGPKTNLREYIALEKGKNPEEAHQRRVYLTSEYRKEVGPIADWLERNGVDLQKVADRINAKIKTGYYEKLAENLRAKVRN